MRLHVNQHRKYTRAKGKNAPKKYIFAPDITRRGAKNAHRISSNNYELIKGIVAYITRSSCHVMFSLLP